MAAFLVKKKQSNRIHFLPVQMSVLWFLCYVNVASCVLTANVLQRLGPKVFDWTQPEGLTGIMLVAICQLVVFRCPFECRRWQAYRDPLYCTQ